MARLRRFDGDLGGFQIANFADHDDVRILAQERAQRCRESESHLIVHIDLVDPGQVDFRRVFRSRNIAVFRC